MTTFTKMEKRAQVDVRKYTLPPSVVPFVRQLTHVSRYETLLLGKKVALSFYSRGENCDKYAEMAGDVLSLLLPYDRCPKDRTIQADVFLCDCEKRLPPKGVVLGPDHINTGYTSHCSPDSLVVYRKDEWAKVFIHECMHHLHLDDGMGPARLPMFRIPNEVRVNEAFCEVWARILNCYLVAAHTGQSAKKLLAVERRHAVRSMEQVLAQMGLKYGDLTTEKAAAYRENTNVFAYVVLAAILLNSPEFEAVFAGFRGSNAKMLALVSKRMNSLQFKNFKKTNRMRMSAINLF